MSYSLYFSGHAEDERAVKLFFATIEASSDDRGFITKRTDDRQIDVDLGDAADTLTITFDDRLVFESAVNVNDQVEDTLRALALMFAEAHQHLGAFLLLDNESTPLLEHGDVDALEALLEDDFDARDKAEKGLGGQPEGPLDTTWFTNSRVHVVGERLRLEISSEARKKISTREWDRLSKGVQKLNGVKAAHDVTGESCFELELLAPPTPDDTKRLAIATSFMVDDAIENTTDAQRGGRDI